MTATANLGASMADAAMTATTDPNAPAKKLGFGCMRLPVLDKDDQTSFDYPLIEELFDAFIARGYTYFDAAYTYHGFRDEEAVRKALVERHARDEFTLATKMPMRELKARGDQERIFAEQLVNCGVERFDYYLLHNIGQASYGTAERFDTFGFLVGRRDAGLIGKLGMSFHDTPELLEEILAEHASQLDFIQLQINYIDWDNPAIQSRRCHEIACRYGLPIVVMEPCKGGQLAHVPEAAERLMRAVHPDMTPASWAIRFAASQEGVFMVLSGMNTVEALQDSMSFMDSFEPLSSNEMSVIDQAATIINADTAIACTGCRYCTKGCPQDIAIPDYFALYNSARRQAVNFSSQFVYYINLCQTHGSAADCVGCGQCEQACPQHLPIIELLKDVARQFDVKMPGR